MNAAAEALLTVLHEERDAARKADLARLEALQERKRGLVNALKEAAPSDQERELLAELAHQNIGLLRHLTQVLHGLLGAPSETTYSASGEASGAAGLKTDRGVL